MSKLLDKWRQAQARRADGIIAEQRERAAERSGSSELKQSKAESKPLTEDR
jgi:hypothetical protein